ncbi:putative tRNA pseudouridine synthase Pus10 [Oryzias melastigma]|uniref:Putative tRNA pseudouridine synthase Pus10 n=1 Tax=Oryzias melastigma TaxID=30732 RepID=A0A834FB92_ORYME|nr:putative tRNA pseudouridine synthase Pus10 [Oryzias melastigma]
MLPLKEKDKPIIQKLLAAGCCARCILRFCCVNLPSAYRQPLQVTLTEIQDFILGAEDEKVQDPATAVSTEENNSQNAAEDPPSKRVKLDPADPSDGSADSCSDQVKSWGITGLRGVFGNPAGIVRHTAGR